MKDSSEWLAEDVGFLNTPLTPELLAKEPSDSMLQQKNLLVAGFTRGSRLYYNSHSIQKGKKIDTGRKLVHIARQPRHFKM